MDEDDWAVSDEHQEEDIESNAVVAESALDRLACGLGGKTVFPQIMALTPVMLQQADWKSRHAALMAISDKLQYNDIISYMRASHIISHINHATSQ